MTRAPSRLTVNGLNREVDAAPETPLLFVLRNDLGLNGPKYGCGLGECGACAVLVDGRSVRSCTTETGRVAGRAVTTLEGLATDGRPHPVQVAFTRAQAAQCGYCLNGMIIATVGLLAVSPDPSDAEIRAALRRHLCRCGTHMEILAAVRLAARLVADEPLPDGAPLR